MTSPDPILTQRIADLLGRITVMESLLPQIKETAVRNSFALEVIQVKNLVKQLQN